MRTGKSHPIYTPRQTHTSSYTTQTRISIPRFTTYPSHHPSSPPGSPTKPTTSLLNRTRANRAPATAAATTPRLRKAIPEILLALVERRLAIPPAAGVFGPFDKAVEVFGCVFGAGLRAFGDIGGGDAGLSGKICFCDLG